MSSVSDHDTSEQQVNAGEENGHVDICRHVGVFKVQAGVTVHESMKTTLYKWN